MQYVLICQDKPNSEGLRKDTRAQHLEYIQGFDIRFAGPTLSEDETSMTGSIIVIDAENRAAAEAFAAGDPYAGAGLFADVSIQAIKQVIP